MNGLTFAEKSVHEISGPVSMRVICPSNSKDGKDKKLYLPGIMLFGDQHDSKENMCEAKNNTYDLDISFFKLFEPYSSPDYPIDVYLEAFETKRGFKEDDGKASMLISLILNKSINKCFRRESDEYKNCGLPSLRWHMADIRDSHRKGIVSFEQYLIESIISFPISDTRPLFREIFENILYSLYDKKKKGYNFKAFVSTFFKEIGKVGRDSLINKQILKKQKGISISLIKSIFEDILQHHSNKIAIDNSDFYKIFPTYESYKNILSSSNKDYNQKNALSVINLYIGASLVDLYTILRILKIPEKGNPPVFVIGYFGEMHSKSIDLIMKKYFNYKSLFNHDINKKNIEDADRISKQKKLLSHIYGENKILIEQILKMPKIINIINQQIETERCIKIDKLIDIQKIIEDRVKLYKTIETHKYSLKTRSISRKARKSPIKKSLRKGRCKKSL